MRLLELVVEDFKNLNNFKINFDKQSAISVLVGRNGTGKSNLIEALTVIFRDLDLNETSPFEYNIKYLCRNRLIEINSISQSDKDNIEYKINGSLISKSEFAKNKLKYLPKFVFGYYSGPSNRLEEYFDRHQNMFYRDLLRGKEKPLRPLLYARLIHSQFVLLAFFIELSTEILHLLKDKLFIEELDSVLFVMREPPWKSRQGDDRFWFARGVVSEFLGSLYNISLAPMRLQQRIQLQFGKSQSREHLYLYIKDLKDLASLLKKYKNQQEFFKALESTYISDLISEVRIRVKTKNKRDVLTFRELSEGEQQLLMVLGLLKFTKEEESLFLLDEPDTHLNPAWSLQYLQIIKDVVGDQENSQIIMATHDPLVIAGLDKSDVRIMQRNEETGEIWSEEPEISPKGMGIAGLLTSDIYGLSTTLDMDTQKKLDRRNQLFLKSKRSKSEDREIKELSDELARLGFSRTIRDPLYAKFIKAMLDREEFQKPVLSPEEHEQQAKLANEVISEILKEESK